jgi:Tfp pilus assembly protein PilO
VNELLDNLLERPGKQKLAILIVTIILIGALYYSFLYSPRAEEVAKLADSVEIAQNEKMVKTQKSANLACARNCSNSTLRSSEPSPSCRKRVKSPTC